MPAKSLTDTFIKNVKPPLKTDKPNQVAYIDTMETGLALVLMVSYGGSKTFYVLDYPHSKPRYTKIGRYPSVSLKQAKEKAREFHADPDKWRAQQQVGTFLDVGQNWLQRHVVARGLRSRREIERQLRAYIRPKWKDRRFIEIRRRDLVELLDHIEDHHGKYMADYCLDTIRAMMAWYQARDENYVSPIVKGMRRAEHKPRERILDDDEIRAIWRVESAFSDFVKVLLLTSVRSAKLIDMRWDDFKGNVWEIRTEPREKGNPGKLVLPKLLMDIIARQPRVHGNPRVFRTSQTYYLKRELDHLSGVTGWRLHDARRTAKSLMARAGVPRDVSERVLGHAIGGVEGTYNRYDYQPEISSALLKLSALIDRIVHPSDNVLALSKQVP